MNKKLVKRLRKSMQRMQDMRSGKIQPRRFWTINPKTRIKESAKLYKRSLSKKEVKDILQKDDY